MCILSVTNISRALEIQILTKRFNKIQTELNIPTFVISIDHSFAFPNGEIRKIETVTSFLVDSSAI